MKQLILTDTAKCEGCNRCIRVCPVNEANIAFMEDGKIKVRVDKEKCIACGACIEVCQHEARDYDDDTERFFNDLRNGVKISLLVAPSVRTNFANWQPLLAWLKASGVGKIIDVSLGADICTWAHIRYIEQNNPASVITQPCPAIVNYITKYETKLLPVLSPVHSPMLCTAVFMKQYLRISDNIAALSPCVAKTHEFEETGLVKYNVTFKKLAEYLAKNRVQIPDASFRFDNVDSSLGRIYSMPGGLKENVEYYLGKSVRIDKAEGQSTVYRHLDELAQEWPANWPPLFDVLNCPEGCNAGTGCLRDKSLFSINKIMDEERQTAVHKYQKTDRAKFTELFKLFDKNLALNDFIRTYVAHSVCPITYDERDVENAFLSLGKTTQEQRKHNCYACGSETCHDMAVRIAKGINVAENCMEKTRSDILQEHKAFIKEKDKSCENLSLILSEVEVIRKRFENVLSDVANIENVLEQYDEMAKLIREMALQTKILSLNASVEAVRAGAAGKGFAVVAQAIRDLATQSQTSVDTVSDTGLSAQKAIGAITQASDKVNTSILKVVNNIEEISQAMNGLNSYDQAENF